MDQETKKTLNGIKIALQRMSKQMGSIEQHLTELVFEVKKKKPY